MNLTLLKLRGYGFHVSVEIRCVHFTRVFSEMTGRIAKVLFILFFAFTVGNGQNIAAYEAYWLISISINNL